MKQRYLLIIASIVFAAVIGCTEKPVDDVDNGTDDQGEVKELDCSFLEACAPKALTSSDKELLEYSTEFAFNFAREVQKTSSESFVISPVSMSYAVGMLSSGAAGQTKKELLDCLGYPQGEGSDTRINEFNRNLIVLSHPDEKDKAMLGIANTIVADKRFPFLDEFKVCMGNYYDASVTNLDFTKESEAVDYVNGWVSDKTNGIIKNYLDKIQGESILINTLYFNALWSTPFGTATFKLPFTRENGSSREEVSMKSSGENGYYEDDVLQLLRMYYIDSPYYMDIFLPKEGYKTTDVLKTMNTSMISKIQKSLKTVVVDTEIPKFKVTSKVGMEGILKGLGVKSIFDQTADFSRMAENDVAITNVMHAVDLVVNEKGTEAAAASSFEFGATAPPVEQEPKKFVADHPFVFSVNDSRTGAVLFLGCYR